MVSSYFRTNTDVGYVVFEGKGCISFMQNGVQPNFGSIRTTVRILKVAHEDTFSCLNNLSYQHQYHAQGEIHTTITHKAAK